MTARDALRYARKRSGLSQRDLARLAGVRQPRIAEAESERGDLRSATLDRFLAPTGHRLVVLPSRATTAAETGEAVRDALAENDHERAFREIIQLSDDLASSEPAIRVALVAAPPPLTDAPRYDALLAGVVEYRLTQNQLPVPAWVEEPARSAEAPWYVDPTPGTEALSREHSPESFTRRNVYLDVSELASV
jgi:transcriptional regulator with XRE-family HTH domain